MSQKPMGQAQSQQYAAPSIWERPKLLLGIVALVALGVFFGQNLQEVEIHFLWLDWNTSLFWALIASALVGAIAMFAFTTFRPRRAKPAAPAGTANPKPK